MQMNEREICKYSDVNSISSKFNNQILRANSKNIVKCIGTPKLNNAISNVSLPLIQNSLPSLRNATQQVPRIVSNSRVGSRNCDYSMNHQSRAIIRPNYSLVPYQNKKLTTLQDKNIIQQLEKVVCEDLERENATNTLVQRNSGNLEKYRGDNFRGTSRNLINLQKQDIVSNGINRNFEGVSKHKSTNLAVQSNLEDFQSQNVINSAIQRNLEALQKQYLLNCGLQRNFKTPFANLLPNYPYQNFFPCVPFFPFQQSYGFPAPYALPLNNQHGFLETPYSIGNEGCIADFGTFRILGVQ